MVLYSLQGKGGKAVGEVLECFLTECSLGDPVAQPNISAPL